MLAKGAEIAAKLEEMLAGKEVRLEDLGLQQVASEKEPKERRLRRFLDQVMGRLRAVDEADFGWDARVGGFVAVAVLDEQPWIDLSLGAGELGG